MKAEAKLHDAIFQYKGPGSEKPAEEAAPSTETPKAAEPKGEQETTIDMDTEAPAPSKEDL